MHFLQDLGNIFLLVLLVGPSSEVSSASNPISDITSIFTSFDRITVSNSTLDLNEWWGIHQEYQDTSIRPAVVYFDEQMIEDLRFRLRRHVPFQPPLKNSGFTYGFNSDAIDSWLHYWAEEYPFKEREAFLNQFPHFTTNIQGLGIHFLWVKPPAPAHKEVIPLLLLHGWPGSIREFYEAIPTLTADHEGRDFAVEVVVPCLPGFGFSDAAVRPGLGAGQMAVVLRNLMHRLGFQRFYVQGGDWGSFIASNMATLFPQEVLGFHTNWALVLGSNSTKSLIKGNEASQDAHIPNRLEFLLEETGYLHLAATKPDTIGIALTDSPAGLLAFVLEKFSTGTTAANRELSDGGLRSTFSPEQLIDNLMMYWSTSSITTSLRLYAETLNKKHFALGLERIPTTVPIWVTQGKYELTSQPPEVLKTKYLNLLNATVLDFGGHFLALEHPQEFSDNLLVALNAFRLWHRKQDNVYIAF